MKSYPQELIINPYLGIYPRILFCNYHPQDQLNLPVTPSGKFAVISETAPLDKLLSGIYPTRLIKIAKKGLQNQLKPLEAR